MANTTDESNGESMPGAPDSGSGLHGHPRMMEDFHSLQMKYKRFFDADGEMRFAVSRSGRILDINQAGVELFGFDCKEEMLRLESVGILFHDPEDGKNFQRRLEVEGFIKDFEALVKKKDGAEFTASITASIWFDENGTISCEGTLRDISELKHLQAACIEAERANRELTESERRIRALNTDILNMLMIMSHDIRGPLVSIAATLKLLMRGSFGGMDQSVANTVQELFDRVRNLIGIAEDCLVRAHSFEGTTRAERNTLDLRQDIIDPVLDEVSNEIELHGITIDNRMGAIPAGCIPINVRMTWLKSVFRNLFKNAIKYGGRDCRIAFGFEDHGAFYRLNVYNSGRPIPEEHREKLFRKFARIEYGADKRDGVGMGLYLIREIVRKHGGDIWYEARPDGSDFILILAKDPV